MGLEGERVFLNGKIPIFSCGPWSAAFLGKSRVRGSEKRGEGCILKNEKSASLGVAFFKMLWYYI